MCQIGDALLYPDTTPSRWPQSPQRFQATPMVALTAHAMAGDAERGRAAGFDDYVTKPIDVATLPSRLSAFLNAAA